MVEVVFFVLDELTRLVGFFGEVFFAGAFWVLHH